MRLVLAFLGGLGAASVTGRAGAQEGAVAQESAVAEGTRQVTVLAILATPGTKEVDPRLASVRTQLRKVLPDHGFRLLEVENKRLRSGQSITCDLGRGYKALTTLENPSDAGGKVQIRCDFSKGDGVEFSKRIKSPANQLFFYERTLDDGKRVLIGVGARTR
jgi:hypothetical protein